MNRSLKVILVSSLVAISLVISADMLYDHWKESEWRSAHITPVSLIKLIASPERFDQLRVGAKGFFVHEEEDYTLYLSAGDAQEGIYANGVELNFVGSKVPSSTVAALNRKYVRIVGRFYADAQSQWPTQQATGKKSRHLEILKL